MIKKKRLANLVTVNAINAEAQVHRGIGSPFDVYIRGCLVIEYLRSGASRTNVASEEVDIGNCGRYHDIQKRQERSILITVKCQKSVLVATMSLTVVTELYNLAQVH